MIQNDLKRTQSLWEYQYKGSAEIKKKETRLNIKLLLKIQNSGDSGYTAQYVIVSIISSSIIKKLEVVDEF